MKDTLTYDPQAAADLDAEIHQWTTDNRSVLRDRFQAKLAVIEYVLQQRGLTSYQELHGLPY